MVFVLGYFGYRTNKLNGQTVKTRDLYKLLNDCVDDDVCYYDTEDFKYNKFSVFGMLWKIMRCKSLYYLPAYGNLKNLFPIIFCISFLFRVKIHYFVVGGWLEDYLKNLPIHRKMLSRIKGIYVETKRLKNGLKNSYHFKNVDIYPNFRYFSYDIDKFNLEITSRKVDNGVLSIAFVSRVDQSKGLDTLVKVAEILALRGYADKVHFDFYGEKRDSFYDVNMSGNAMFRYKGILQPSEVMDMLKNYDVLILPTHYDGEGCPGILVETLAVGLPIIASDWKYNDEFVENGVNGFLCETYNADAYVNAIITLTENTDLRISMSKQSYIKSSFFSIDNAKELLMEIIKTK